MTDLEHIQHQINVNFAAYVTNYKEQLEREHRGKVALMRQGQLVDVFDTVEEADANGSEQFPERDYMLQKIGSEPLHYAFA